MKIKISSKNTWLILGGSILLAVLLLCFTATNLFQSRLGLADSFDSLTFGDVPVSHPNYDAITYVYDRQIVEGYPDGTFRPDSLINRAEFTKIITETYFPGQAVGENCFPDVGYEWFAKYVCFNQYRGFIAGYPDGFFRPANNINFAETAKILVNLKGAPVTSDPDFWYAPYVGNLSAARAIPVTITSFDQMITRGEMAEMIYRLRAGITDKPVTTYLELEVERDAAGLPVRLLIPGINVEAAVESVGLTPEGAVGIPLDPDNAAWYALGPRPGDIGSAVVTGHINWYYGAIGVFVDLSKLEVGDKIMVQDDKGATFTFTVREIRSYDAEANVPDVFFSYDGKAHLNLITCEGVWDPQAQRYTKRLVVFTDRE